MDNINFQKISENFYQELVDSSNGSSTSLPFVHHTIPTDPLVKVGQIIQGFVFGGTYDEVATAKVTKDYGIEIINHKRLDSPVFKTKEMFLEFIKGYFYSEAVGIGINFAFNLNPVVGRKGELDGKLEARTGKGHDFIGLHGNAVGDEIKKFLRRENDLVVSIVNDTICLLLAGLGKNISRENLCAGIVGTGYNLGFFLNPTTAINIESANFDKYPQTLTGKIVDQNSNNPGIQVYEKELAGGSLYRHFNILMENDGKKEKLVGSTEELTELILREDSDESRIAKMLFERSAFLVAAHISGLYKFKNQSSLIMIMQGGMFWDAPNYKESVSNKMIELGVPENSVSFIQVEESNILGAFELLLA